MNGAKYKEELLNDKLRLYMEVHNTKIFMHDGAPHHLSKTVAEFLKKSKLKLWTG